jgi:hypothetical protein
VVVGMGNIGSHGLEIVQYFRNRSVIRQPQVPTRTRRRAAAGRLQYAAHSDNQRPRFNGNNGNEVAYRENTNATVNGTNGNNGTNGHKSAHIEKYALASLPAQSGDAHPEAREDD